MVNPIPTPDGGVSGAAAQRKRHAPSAPHRPPPGSLGESGQTLTPPSVSGLSLDEAAELLKQYGYNELPSSRKRSILAIAWAVLREPMLLLLIATCAVYLVLGDHAEALLLLASMLLVVGIALYQERRTERTLEALRDLSSPRALVVRGGEQQRIAGREVVPGDLLVLAEGDRIPADAVVSWSINLSVDESLLTGESVPVRKSARDSQDGAGAGADASVGTRRMERPGGDDQPFVFSGTMVVQGHGQAQVVATGARTELGTIGKALQTVRPEQTRLQHETGRLVGVLAAAGLTLCIVVVIAYGLSRGDWPGGLLAGLTLAMGLVPEEFPVVLAVFLALGAWRLAQRRVLTRRSAAIETLGSATVLCVDKTGTLTRNQMAVAKLFAGGESYAASEDERSRDEVRARFPEPLPETFHALIQVALLASQTDPFDPMERALRRLAEQRLPGDAGGDVRAGDGWNLVHEYPLSRHLLAMSHVWRAPQGGRSLVAAKGAPEAIAELCRFTAAQWEPLAAQVAAMAAEGLRVLAVARADFPSSVVAGAVAGATTAALPEDQRAFGFEFLGLIGLADPLRPEVPAAIEECYGAGIRVVMITGDYPGTAQAIARQIGLASGDGVLTGPELERMPDAELREHIRTVNVFARVVPQQKLRLVNALKERGEIVAMTGDGVNDAPALKAAHIGVAMGARGTDVAREAAALVLLDDDFSSIVRAVRMGRRVFDNLSKAMAFLFAVHVPIAGLSLVPALLGWPLILLPAHIVFLEFIIDPACSIVFEAEREEDEVMRRPPRSLEAPLFGRWLIGWSTLQGAGIFLIALGVYAASLFRGQGDLQARALAFTTLVVADLGLILATRSRTRSTLATLRTPNAALAWVVGGAVGLLGLVLYVPFLRRLFRFETLHADDLAISLAAGVAGILWLESVKLLARWHGRQAGLPNAIRS